MDFFNVFKYPHDMKRLLTYFLLATAFFTLSFNASAKNSLTEQLQDLLNTSIAHSNTPGAVLLVSSPDLGTITVAAGLADKKKNVAMKVTNNFRIASMSKLFLAVAVLKLIEQGKLKLNDKIADLLPDTIDVERISNANNVTVRQLLQMRSGIPNYIDYESYLELIDKMIGKEWTPELCIELIYDKKGHSAPGIEYEYSNTNYLLLQLIVENLEGVSYADVIREQILDPLELKHTFIETQESDDTHFLQTKGYSLEDEQLIDVTNYNDGWGLGDGGIISTAEDLNRFINALLKDNKLLSAVSLRRLLSFKDDYGLGIWREEINDEMAWSHNGSSSGFQGQFYYFPEQQLTIILLTNNFDTEEITDIITQAHQLVTGN